MIEKRKTNKKCSFLFLWQEIQLAEMLTHRVDLDDINRAFELLKDADCLKIVIKISDK